MQIICISRGSYGYSSEVAEKLAEKTGYAAVSRDTITDKATEFGIPIGKLEMTVLKGRPISEEMSNVVDMFKAFATAYLCEKATKESVIYHGRTGHMVLPGLTNVLRIRAIADLEYRIKMVMNRLKLGREKAKNYIAQVDDDIKRWANTLYNTDWKDPSQYDITINAAHLSAENATTALINFVQLPEFQATPSSRSKLQDLLLAAKCRLAIGADKRTREVKVGIHVNKGKVSVTHMPRHSEQAKAIPDVLKPVEGISSLVCTMATTNILCIAEKFDPNEDYFKSLIEISKKWNAAIEITRIAGENEKPTGEPLSEQVKPSAESGVENGGILEDTDKHEESTGPKFGVYDTMDRLIQLGLAGGSRTVYGGTDSLLKSLPARDHYSLVAVGDVFSSKGAARQRKKREMIGKLKDSFKVPVIGTEDLKARYLFGPRQFIALIWFAFLAALLYLIVFTFQEPILSFISRGHFGASFSAKITAALVVTFCIPFIAHIIGGFYQNLLKFLKVE